MNKEDTLKYIERLDGWLSKREAGLLYDLAKKCTGKGVIVEIGSWMGKSTVAMGHGSKEGNHVKIHAIDPHTGCEDTKQLRGEMNTFKQFQKNIKDAKITDVVVPIVNTSVEAAKDFKEKVELIFVDGAHEFDMVMDDFNCWFPKVVDGGYMVFHDTSWSGAGDVVAKCLYKSKRFRNVTILDDSTYAQKVKKNSLKDRFVNHSKLHMRDSYRIGVKVGSKVLPKPIKNLGNRMVDLVKSFL